MMRDHELVNVKKHNQHKHDSCRGNSACRWDEKTDPPSISAAPLAPTSASGCA